LSPMLAEKYLEAAKEELNIAFKNPVTRDRILIARPEAGVSVDQAARKVLTAFLPLAFRRPARSDEVESYLDLVRVAQKRGENFNNSVLFSLSAVLISPQFLFR